LKAGNKIKLKKKGDAEDIKFKGKRKTPDS
jgi:hypothetical protein